MSIESIDNNAVEFLDYDITNIRTQIEKLYAELTSDEQKNVLHEMLRGKPTIEEAFNLDRRRGTRSSKRMGVAI